MILGNREIFLCYLFVYTFVVVCLSEKPISFEAKLYEQRTNTTMIKRKNLIKYILMEMPNAIFYEFIGRYIQLYK